MRLIGVDPGYANLGLAIVEVEGPRPELLVSETLVAGSDRHPSRYVEKLRGRLFAFEHEFGPFDGLGTETPPIIVRKPKTSVCIMAASQVVYTWAGFMDPPVPIRDVSPLRLKKVVANALGIPWRKDLIPPKSKVRQLVAQLMEGNRVGHTSHENDAIMAALIAWVPRLITHDFASRS